MDRLTKFSLIAAVVSAIAAIGSAVFAWQQAGSAKTALTSANRNGAYESLLQSTVALCLTVPPEFGVKYVRSPDLIQIYRRDPNVLSALPHMNVEAREAQRKLDVAIAIMRLWSPRPLSKALETAMSHIIDLKALRQAIPEQADPLPALAIFNQKCEAAMLILTYVLIDDTDRFRSPNFRVVEVSDEDWNAIDQPIHSP